MKRYSKTAGFLFLVVSAAGLLAGTCSGCDLSGPTEPPVNRTVLITQEGAVVFYYRDVFPQERRESCAAEVEEGYRDGRVLWGYELPPTSSFSVSIVSHSDLGPEVSGRYWPKSGSIETGPDCAALDDDLQHHFCHYGQLSGVLPSAEELDCTYYWLFVRR